MRQQLWTIETVNPTCLISTCVARQGFERRRNDSSVLVTGKERSLTTSALTTKSAAPRAKLVAKATPALAVSGRPLPDETLHQILARLDDMKAEETVTIDLRGKSTLSDYMVITSGRANRHVGAIAENVLKGLAEIGLKGVHVEGLQNCDWVLIDCGDVIVHVFRPEVRDFYGLEKMWMPGRTSQAS